METEIERLRRKRDQAYELAGCARRDRDVKDEQHYLEQAREYNRQILELIDEGVEDEQTDRKR